MTPTRIVLQAAAMMLTLAMIAVPAAAHDPIKRPVASAGNVQLAQSLRAAEPECYCWANGQRFAHGEQACVRAPGGTRLAVCDRVTNVMSWSFSADPCPES